MTVNSKTDQERKHQESWNTAVTLIGALVMKYRKDANKVQSEAQEAKTIFTLYIHNIPTASTQQTQHMDCTCRASSSEKTWGV